MKKHLLLLLMAAALIAGGCKSLEPFFARPDVSFETLSVKDMSLTQATLVFTFRVHNPNPMGVNVNAATYDLRIDDRPMARGTFDDGIRLPAAAARSMDLPVTINFTDVFQNFAAMATRESVPYVLSGSFNMLGFDLPYRTEGSLPVPKLPRISLKSVRVGKVGFSGADLDFILTLANPNPFPVHPAGLDYAIELGGIRFLSGQTQTVSAVGANGTTQVTIPATIDFIGLGRTAMHLLNNASAPYNLSGNLRFDLPGTGQQALAFDKSGQVSLVRQ